MNPEWRSRYEAAVDAAQQAGRLALRYFDAELAVELKSDRSPVTAADREAEAYLRTTLLRHFPNDAFLGEESGQAAGTSGFRWVIDPIDGTRNFVRAIPFWATLVGLEYHGEQIGGVVYLPAVNLLYRALRGDGAFRGERRIRVSDTAALDEALVFYSSLSWFQQYGSQEAFFRLGARTQLLRGYGDFYGYVLVAQGSGELMVEHGIKPWDVAAVKAIVEEAGGRFTSWDGTPTIERPDVVASNGKLHQAALKELQEQG